MSLTFRPGEGAVEDDIPLDTDSAAVAARTARDRALRETDWTQLPDAPLTQAQRSEWVTYRQALRDLPEAAGFPDAAPFPERPGRKP